GGRSMRKLALAFADGSVVAKRNLIKIRRVPEILIWTTMSPIMFVLLFGLVFGSSIVIPGVSYREYLIAGIFVQTVIFGSTFAEWNPVSSVAQAVREAFGNTGRLPKPHVWSLAHPIAYSLIWVGIILAIFVPLSVRQYKKAASKRG